MKNLENIKNIAIKNVERSFNELISEYENNPFSKKIIDVIVECMNDKEKFFEFNKVFKGIVGSSVIDENNNVPSQIHGFCNIIHHALVDDSELTFNRIAYKNFLPYTSYFYYFDIGDFDTKHIIYHRGMKLLNNFQKVTFVNGASFSLQKKEDILFKILGEIMNNKNYLISKNNIKEIRFFNKKVFNKYFKTKGVK